MTRADKDRAAALAASIESQARAKRESAADMFPETKVPRAKPRVMAHVFDAGCSCETELARFECKRCGWQSEWLSVASISDGKRGIPCPTCNTGDSP